MNMEASKMSGAMKAKGLRVTIENDPKKKQSDGWTGAEGFVMDGNLGGWMLVEFDSPITVDGVEHHGVWIHSRRLA